MREHRMHLLMYALMPAVMLCILAGCVGTVKEVPPPASDVLEAMRETAGVLPAGEVYDLAADPAGRGYLSQTLIAALYGPAARSWLGGADDEAPAMIADAAVFLSLREHPGEMAVLRCADADGALTAAALCRFRLDSLKNAWRETEYASWTEYADVTVEGCYVLMAVCPDPDTVFDAARRVIRG